MKTNPRINLPAKSDDQNAYEVALSFEEIGRSDSALEWYAEVSQDGGRWDRAAVESRVALLLALNRSGEAVEIGVKGLQRMTRTSPPLIGEVARALNVQAGPGEAMKFCRAWLKFSPTCQRDASLWFSTAAYAVQCGQFGRSLRYLGYFLETNGEQRVGDLFLDFDFAPLWRHLGQEELSPDEGEALRRPVWQAGKHLLESMCDQLSFESIGHVPPTLRSMLLLDLRSMTWQPAPSTKPARLAAYDSWCASVRAQARADLQSGFDKALALSAPLSGPSD